MNFVFWHFFNIIYEYIFLLVVSFYMNRSPHFELSRDRVLLARQLKKASRNDLIRYLNEFNEPYVESMTDFEIAQIIQQKLTAPIETQEPRQSILSPDETQYIYVVSSRILFILVSIFFCYIIFTGIKSYTMRYCDEKHNKNCKACPYAAKCQNRKIICEKDRKLLNGFCVLNNKDAIHIALMLKKVSDALKLRAGSYKCLYSRNDWMSLDEIEILAFKEYKGHPDDYNRIYKYALEQLKNESTIITKPFDQTLLFISEEYQRPVKCIVISLFKQNIFLLFISIVLIASTFVVHIIKNRNRAYQIQANQYAIPLINEIKKFKGNEVKIYLLRQRLSEMTSDVDYFWPYVVDILKRSSVLTNRIEDGEIRFRYIGR